MTNNLVVGNSAPNSGGGVSWAGFPGTTSSFVNNTLAGNQAPGWQITGAGLTLTNNVLMGPAGSTTVTCTEGAEQGTVFSHNDVYSGTASPYAGCADPTGTNGNISADPLLAADNRLQPGSPAMDAGDNAVASLPATDHFGGARVTDGDGVAVVDMGAIESAEVAVTGDRYHPLTPARILDTRTGLGAPAARLGPASTLALKVTGVGGIPASGVSAVVLHVAVTQPTAPSYLTAWPAGTGLPLAANLNYAAGETVANLVTVKVGADGKVNLYNAAGSADVIADVAGWYGGATAGARYHPLTPARILDTRSALGAPAKLGSGASLSLQVTGRGGVPATGVSAVVLNLAVTGTTTHGWIAAWPTGETRPFVSSLNYAPGQTVSNLAIVKVGAGGKVDIYNELGSTEVIADVAGWFGEDGGTGGSGLNGLLPARVLDTRTGTGAPAAAVNTDGTVSLQVTGRGGVPATGVSAVVLNVTVTGPATPGWIAAWPAGEARPLVANVNYVAGQTVPNLVVVKVGTDGMVNLYTSGGPVHIVADVAGWFA